MASNQASNAAAAIEEQDPVAIIGFGPAGVNAAIALRQSGYNGKIDVFSDISTLPYSPILTSYYVAGEKDLEGCFPWTADEIAELELDIHYGCPVLKLDPQSHSIETPDGVFAYSKCLVSTGSTPQAHGFPAGCGYKPLMLRSMDDAKAMKAAFEREGCNRVLVSGASMVALKTVEAALANGLDVTLVGMNPHVLDFNALPPAAERFERGLLEKGVTLQLGQTIEEVKVANCGEDGLGASLHVSFSSGDEADFDEICVAHGMSNNLEFLAGAGIEREAGLLVDEYMRTSNPDIYAAGDVAQAVELTSGVRKVVGIWKNAVLQGRVAGEAIAAELLGAPLDGSCAFKGSLSSNTIAVDGTLFLSAGSMDVGEGRHFEVREGEEMTVVYIFDDTRKNKDGRSCLVGFNVTSDVDEEGGRAYDVAAMLSLRIEEDCLDKA